MSQKIEINGVSFLVNPDRNPLFWNKVANGEWEPETFQLFDELITSDALFMDIGAWIGSTAMYAAQKSARTVAFEPDPIAFAELAANAELNAKRPWHKNLELVNKAINSDGSDLKIGSRGSGGDSMTSALFSGSDCNWTVSGTTLQDALSEYSTLNQPVVLKIDIEGGEYELLPQIAQILALPNVRMILSLHPSFLRASLQKEFGQAWRLPFYRKHLALINALPKNRNVIFGRRNTRSRLLAKLRARLTGDFTKQIVLY